jgi:hypothetical protein
VRKKQKHKEKIVQKSDSLKKKEQQKAKVQRKK